MHSPPTSSRTCKSFAVHLGVRAIAVPVWDETKELSCTEAEAYHCHVMAYCYTFETSDGSVRRPEPICECPEGFLGNGWVFNNGTFETIKAGFNGGPYTGCQGQGFTARVVLKLPPVPPAFCANGKKICEFTDQNREVIAAEFFGMPVNGYWSIGAMHHQVTQIPGGAYLTINALWPDAGQARASATVFKREFPNASSVDFPFSVTEYAPNGEPRVYRWKTETTSAPIAIQATGMQIDGVHFQPSCAKSGCWVIDITYTTGASTGNFNTFYLPKAEASDTLSSDPVYSATELATFQPKNFPCGSNVVNPDVTTCCLSDMVADYRPVESFVTWAGSFTACTAGAGALIQRPGFEERYPDYTVNFPYDMLSGKFEGMPDSPGVEFGGVVDAYIDQYKATVYLDEVELRTKAGQLKGTVGVEHTVDTFIGIANFRPTGLAAIDPAAHQVNVHLEKTSFFSVSTHGTNDYTFLQYINLRLVSVLREDANFIELPVDFGTRSSRTNSTGAAHYVQVTFTMGSQYRPNLPTGLIPMDSVRAGKGTFFEDETTQNTLRHKCVDYLDGELEFSDFFVRRSGVLEEERQEEPSSGSARHLLHHGQVNGEDESGTGNQVAGSLDTCHEQSHCFTYSWKKVWDAGCQHANNCSWEVCQIYNPSADAFCKDTAELTFKRWCKFDGTGCPGEVNSSDPADDWFTDAPGAEGSATQENCQIGRPGEYVFFIVADGNACGHWDNEPYQLSGVQREMIADANRGTVFPQGAEAYCQPRSRVIKGCENCGFTVTTYENVGGSSRRRAVRVADAASRQAEAEASSLRASAESTQHRHYAGRALLQDLSCCNCDDDCEANGWEDNDCKGTGSCKTGCGNYCRTQGDSTRDTTRDTQGPLDSCSEQNECMTWTFRKTDSSTDLSGLCGAAGCEYEICLEIDLDKAYCNKDDTISHTCTKRQDECIPDNQESFAFAAEISGVGHGFTQCQRGLPGSTLLFLLKDGSGCNSEGAKETFGTPVAGLSASSFGRPGEILSCTGNGIGKECVWEITVPACDASSGDGGNNVGDGGDQIEVEFTDTFCNGHGQCNMPSALPSYPEPPDFCVEDSQALADAFCVEECVAHNPAKPCEKAFCNNGGQCSMSPSSCQCEVKKCSEASATSADEWCQDQCVLHSAGNGKTKNCDKARCNNGGQCTHSPASCADQCEIERCTADSNGKDGKESDVNADAYCVAECRAWNSEHNDNKPCEKAWCNPGGQCTHSPSPALCGVSLNQSRCESTRNATDGAFDWEFGGEAGETETVNLTSIGCCNCDLSACKSPFNQHSKCTEHGESCYGGKCHDYCKADAAAAGESGRGGGFETCGEQQECITWTFSQIAPGQTCTGESCEWQVCLTLALGGDCRKTGAISHWCEKDDDGCTPSNEDFTESTSHSELGTGASMCQTGASGSTLRFLLKDGKGCSEGNPLAYSDTELNASFSCRPSVAADNSCSGQGNDGKECVWDVVVPECDAEGAAAGEGGAGAGEGAESVVIHGIDTCSEAPPESECVWSIKIPDECSPDPTCDDGILNQDETGIDCGGTCGDCDCGRFVPAGTWCGTAVSAYLETSQCSQCECATDSPDFQVAIAAGKNVCGDWGDCHLCKCDVANDKCGPAGSSCNETCTCEHHYPDVAPETMCGSWGECQECVCSVHFGNCGIYPECRDDCTCANDGGDNKDCGVYNGWDSENDFGCHDCTCAGDAAIEGDNVNSNETCGVWGTAGEGCYECTCEGFARDHGNSKSCGILNGNPDDDCHICTCPVDGNDGERCGSWPACKACTCKDNSGDQNKKCGTYNSSAPDKGCERCSCDAHDTTTWEPLAEGTTPLCGGSFDQCHDCTCDSDGPIGKQCGTYDATALDKGCKSCTCEHDSGNTSKKCGTYDASEPDNGCEQCTCEAFSGDENKQCGTYDATALDKGCKACTCKDDSGSTKKCGTYDASAPDMGCEDCSCDKHDTTTLGPLAEGTPAKCGTFSDCYECTCKDDNTEDLLCGEWGNCQECSCTSHGPADKQCGVYNASEPSKGCHTCKCLNGDGGSDKLCGNYTMGEENGGCTECELPSCESQNLCGDPEACHDCSCSVDLEGSQCGDWGNCRPCNCRDDVADPGQWCGENDACVPCNCSAHDQSSHELLDENSAAMCGDWDSCKTCTCEEHGGGNQCGVYPDCEPCTCDTHDPATKRRPVGGNPPESACGRWGTDGSDCETCNCTLHSTTTLQALEGVDPQCGASWPECSTCTCANDGGDKECGGWPSCETCSCKEHGEDDNKCGDYASNSCQPCECNVHDPSTNNFLGANVVPERGCGGWGTDGSDCETCNCTLHSTTTLQALEGVDPQCGASWPECSTCTCANDGGDKECGGWPSCETCSCKEHGEGANQCGDWDDCEPCECGKHDPQNYNLGGDANKTCGNFPETCHECTCEDDNSLCTFEEHGDVNKQCGDWVSSKDDCRQCTCEQDSDVGDCGDYPSCETCECGKHDPVSKLVSPSDKTCGSFGSCHTCNCPQDGENDEKCGDWEACRACNCTENPKGKNCPSDNTPTSKPSTPCGVAASSPNGFSLPPAIGGASPVGPVPGEDCCLPFDCALQQRCSSGASMCVSPLDTPDNFVSFNIPLGIDWFPEPSDQLDANVFVSMVINAVDKDQAAVSGNNPNDGDAPEQMKTTLFASIPVVRGGINIFCDGITAKTDLKDVANADIVVGSAASAEELTRLRILVDIASTAMDAVNSSRIDSDSIEAGLMTLVLKGNSSYFNENGATSRHSLVLEDLITIHIMEPDTCGSNCVFDVVKRLLLDLPDDNFNVDNGLRGDGYALNGAFDFEVERSTLRAHLQPTADLLARCPFNPPRPSAANAFPTTCVTRRDVQNAGFPNRIGALSTAMELEPLLPSGTCSTEMDDEIRFMQIILGASNYAADLAEKYSCVIAKKYKIDGRYKRAFWINPGYEWTPTQTGGQSIFTVSQKLFLFALIRLDEGFNSVEPLDSPPTPSGTPTLSRRRQLLQGGEAASMQGTGAGSAGTLQEFDVSIKKLMASSFGVDVDNVATFKVSMRLTDEEVCMATEHERMTATRARLAALVKPHASKLETVQIVSMVVDRGHVDCSAARRAIRRQLLSSGASADVEMMLVFSKGVKAEFSRAGFATEEGIESATDLDVTSAVDTSIPAGGMTTSGGAGDDEASSESGSDAGENTALIAGCSAAAGVLLLGAGGVMFWRARQAQQSEKVFAVSSITGAHVYTVKSDGGGVVGTSFKSLNAELEESRV